MRTSDIIALETLLQVADLGGFRRAAKVLELSPSVVSSRIRQLEEHLGVRLLNRSTRSVSLTSAGELLAGRARISLDQLRHDIELTSNFRETKAGKVRLGIHHEVPFTSVVPLIARFMDKHPLIEIEVNADGTFDDIVRDRFDVAICVTKAVAKDMIAARIGTVTPMVVAAPKYLQRRGRPTTPFDLNEHDCLTVKSRSGVVYPWHFMKDDKQYTLTPHGRLSGNNVQFALAAALHGWGLFYGGKEDVLTWVNRGKLHAVLEDWAWPSTDIRLYYTSRRQPSGAAAALIGFLRKAFKDSVIGQSYVTDAVAPPRAP